jgi:uncharacterized membrane protein YdcZ (DUF606 family)
MSKRFAVLRILSTIYKILGIILAIITILSSVGICLTGLISGAAVDQIINQMNRNSSVLGVFGGALGGILISVGIILYGGLGAVATYALGELIELLLSIEENTRASSLLLQKQNP